MKAVRFHAHGGPDVLRYEDAADPTPGPGEALVRVRACALNHLDLWQRRGMERVPLGFPHISGADVAGEVISTPDGEFGAGRRVMVQPGLSCGRCAACLDGRDNECPKYDVLGYRSDGGYAEIMKVRSEGKCPQEVAKNLFELLKEVDYVPPGFRIADPTSHAPSSLTLPSMRHDLPWSQKRAPAWVREAFFDYSHHSYLKYTLKGIATKAGRSLRRAFDPLREAFSSWHPHW